MQKKNHELMLFPTLLCRSCNFYYSQLHFPKRLSLKMNFSNVLAHPIYQRLCRNPNLGLTTKANAYQNEGQE
jgi:hypothetical protein